MVLSIAAETVPEYVDIVSQVGPLVDAGYDKGRLFRQNFIDGYSHTISRCATDAVDMITELFDSQRFVHGERMAYGAAFPVGRNHISVADFLHGFKERNQTLGMYAVIICDKNNRH